MATRYSDLSYVPLPDDVTPPPDERMPGEDYYGRERLARHRESVERYLRPAHVEDRLAELERALSHTIPSVLKRMEALEAQFKRLEETTGASLKRAREAFGALRSDIRAMAGEPEPPPEPAPPDGEPPAEESPAVAGTITPARRSVFNRGTE